MDGWRVIWSAQKLTKGSRIKWSVIIVFSTPKGKRVYENKATHFSKDSVISEKLKHLFKLLLMLLV